MLIGNLNLIGIDDVFSYANNTNEQTLLEILSKPEEPIFLFKINLDLSTLTKNATIRIYYKVDGINYIQRYGIGVAGGSVIWYQNDLINGSDPPQVSFLINDICSHDVKVTIQSASAQGSTRNIPYSYNGGK